MSDEYYTAKEAMRILKEAKSTFYREVEAGIIPSVGGKRNRKFPKDGKNRYRCNRNEKSQRSHERGGLRKPSRRWPRWSACQ